MTTQLGKAVRLVALGFALAACGSDPVKNDGAPPESSAGNGATGGSAAGTGGMSGGGTGGGAGADPCAPKPCESRAECTPVTPADALITDFSGLDTGIFHAPSGEWWLEFFGGPYVYPAVDECAATPTPTVLLQDLSAESQHVTGRVGTWSGFGLWFAPCVVDLSAYSALSFTISGDAGPSGSVFLHVVTASNLAPSTDPRSPTCAPNVATCVPEDPELPGNSCRAGSFAVADIAAARTVTVPFADVVGGLPEDTTDPSQILGIGFEFQWMTEWASADEYDVDVVLDDVMLVP